MEDAWALLSWLGLVTVIIGSFLAGVLICLMLQTVWGTPYKKLYLGVKGELRDSKETPIGLAKQKVGWLKDSVNATVRKQTEVNDTLDECHHRLKEAREELRVLLEKEQDRIETELKFVPGAGVE